MTATATDPITATITRTETVTLYVDVTTDGVALSNAPSIAFLDPDENPSAATTWTATDWDGAESVTGTTHTRTLSVLVAGPDGLMTDTPLVIDPGEWDTWVRITTSSERHDIRANMLHVLT